LTRGTGEEEFAYSIELIVSRFAKGKQPLNPEATSLTSLKASGGSTTTTMKSTLQQMHMPRV
jgi:hypothetical protein